jgi:hypothetical protein
MSCSLRCPECKIQCSFPHGSDQEEFLQNILPEGSSFHECIGGHGWLKNNLGEVAITVSNIAPHTHTHIVSNDRVISLKDIK